MMSVFTFPPLSERAPLSPYAWPIWYFTLITILSLPPTYNLRFVFLLTIALPALAALPYYTTGSAIDDYLIGSGFGTWIFNCLDYFVLSQPEKEFWRVHRKGTASDIKEGSVEEEREKKRWDKVGWSVEKWLWSMTVFLTARGIGWSWEVKNIPPKKPVGYPARKFFLTHLLRFLLFYILVDITEVYSHSLPQSHNPPVPVSAEPVLQQIVIAWNHWIKSYCSLNLSYSFLATLATVSGLSEPRDWPNLFGWIGDTWSVRQFWGRTWHQILRRPLSTIGRSVARLFGFRKGTNASSYTQLYVGFFVSALIHIVGALHTARHDLGELRFFMSQAVAITFEDIVIATAKKLGIRPPPWLAKIVGYLWVIGWLSYSLKDWMGGIIGAGAWIPWLLPYSPVMRAMELLGV